MTLDDLRSAYNRGFWSVPEAAGLQAQQNAGIAAVVRAVRDEVDKIWIDEDMGCGTILDVFNQILGDAGNEKVAGGSSSNADKATEAGGARCATPCASAPATDPAPDVCVWRDDAYIGCFTTSCSDDAAWNRLGGTPKDEGYNFCPSCGKPISFKTEA